MIRPGGVGLHQQQQVPLLQTVGGGGVAGGGGGVMPDVDMSHLSEEERMLIESVMAKAQMEELDLKQQQQQLPLLQHHSRYNITLIFFPCSVMFFNEWK